MKLRTLGVVSSLALAIAMTAPAYAQDNADNNASNSAASGSGDQAAAPGDQIVVTATFRETNVQDTPLAITAVDSEMLRQRGQTDISQVAAEAPNVTLTPQPQLGGIGLIAFIRGVGQTDFDFALEPGVGIYVDDVYIPTLSSSLLNLMDLDRVEILRGPQGVLGGKNSIGGSIKLFSQKPQGSGKGYLEAGYGSFNEINLRGMADFAITSNLSARVSGVSTTHDGWIDMIDYANSHTGSNLPSNNARGGFTKVGAEGSQNMQAARLALRWQPNDRIDINISGDYTNEHDSPGPEVLIAAGKPLPTATDPTPFTPDAAHPNPATNANGGAWLPGLDGNPVPVDCHFVPYGQYGCDSGRTLPSGVDPRYMTYANFFDGMVPTTQAPFKPYATLQDSDYVGWGVMGNVKVDLTDQLNATWISSYRKYQSNFSQDQDATPVPVAQLDNQLNHSAWSQELRINGALGANNLFEYTVGGFYMKQDARYTARVDLNYAGIDFVHGPDTTPSTSKALFFNGVLHPTDGWSISGGVRRSWDEKTYTYFRRNPDLTIPGGCAFFGGAPTAGPTGIGNEPNCLLNGLYDVAGQFKGSRWDWRAETDYRWSDQLMTYASISTGYMGGGVNPRPFYGHASGPCPPITLDANGHVIPSPACDQITSFDPETLTTYEIGFKADLFDRRLRLNAAAFYNKFNDIILTLSACPSTPCQEPRNVGKADVKGFELEMSARPVDGLTLDGSLSYINFNYDDASVAPVGLTGDEITPYTPEWTYGFGVQYDYTMKNDSTLGARFDGSYQSKIYTETFNTSWGEVDGRFIANGRIYYKSSDDNWELSIEAKNLFNKYYFVTKSDVSASLGVVTGQPGMPRTFMASVRRNF